MGTNDGQGPDLDALVREDGVKICRDPDCIDDRHFEDDERCVSWTPDPVETIEVPTGELHEADGEPIVRHIVPNDPSTFFPGLSVRNIPDDTYYSIKARKDDDSGWWLVDANDTEAGGIADRVWIATGQWEVCAPIALEDEDAEITDIGFDPDSMDAEDITAMVALMHDSNELRVKALEEAAGPGQQGSLENVFDSLRMIVYIEQIAAKLDISELCALDFEGRRAKMLTNIEETYAKMKAARDAAERAQRLAGGPAQGRPGPRPMGRPGA